MTYVSGAPLFRLTQFLDITYSAECEEYTSVEAALEDYVSTAPRISLASLVSDIEYLEREHPDTSTWRGLFRFVMPFSAGDFPAFLASVKAAAVSELGHDA